MPHRRRRDADGGPPSSPGRPPAQTSRVRAARERERALPRSDFWVLSFGKSGSLKGNYTRKATDNGVGGDRAVFRRGVGEGSELELHCPSLVLQERPEFEPKRETDGEGDHATDRKARWTGTREGSGRITSFNVGGGERWTFFCRVPFGETSPSAHSLPFYSRSGHFSAQKPVANSL